jgi:acetyl-CoA synthetase
MNRTTGRAAYRAVRDMLLRRRDDYDAAVAAFRWPDIGDRFNWALDWFDPISAGNERTALRIIGEDGSDRSYSFAESATRHPITRFRRSNWKACSSSTRRWSRRPWYRP